ncbi:MAG: hypothetical protein ACTSVB_11475 [Candidatus Heimdallarchaeaceae archaeon]
MTMSIPSIFAFAFIIESTLLLSFTTFIFMKTYLQIRHISNFLMSIGTGLVMISYFVSFGMAFIDQTDVDSAKIILSITNMVITLGLFLIALSLFYIKSKYFNIAAIVGSFLIGIAFITVSNTENLKMHYDENVRFWINDYTKYANILMSLIFLIIVILITLYVNEKIRYIIRKKKLFSFTVLGIFFAFAWLAIISIPGVYVFRVFLLPISLFFLGLDNLFNPLSLIVSHNKPTEIFLLSKTNVPLVGFNYSKGEKIEDLSDIRILRVSQLLIEEKVGETKDAYFSAKQGELISIAHECFILTIIAKKIDSNLRSVLYLILQEFCECINYSVFISSEVLKQDEEEKFLMILKSNLDAILY